MPRQPVQLQLSVEYVTPEIAIDWLEKNTHNRKISERLIGVYAVAMKEDEWRLNGEPIIFDKKGVLQSGQHRLRACIEAEVGFWTVVVRGAEPEALYTLDVGRRRRMTDVLTLRGEKDVANLATAVTWMWRYQVGAMDRPGETATTSHLLKMLDAHPEIRDYLVPARRVQRVTGFSAGLLSALYWAFSDIDAEDAAVFYNGIADFISLERDDPRFILYRWAANAKMDARRPSQVTIAAVVIKAWNAWREHRSLRQLSFRGSENFPEVL